MSNITKNETRKIFDISKIGVGDIIEFNEYTGGLLTKQRPLHRIAGVVNSVEPETVWVSARGGFSNLSVHKFGLPVNRAEEITLLFRHPLNLKEARK